MVSTAELILLKGKIKAIILRDSEGYFDGQKAGSAPWNNA